MIAEQRHALILDEIGRNRSVAIADLEKRLNVSRETLRRDITTLDGRNLLRQVRGGAVAVDRVENSLARRVATNPAGKSRIAALAAGLIPDGATVIVDSGTTPRAIARELTRKAGLTAITNDIHAALLLLDTAEEVHLLGGVLGGDEHSTQGHEAIDMLQRYPADFALVSAGGLSGDYGFTDFSPDAAKLRDTMIAGARISIMLADHTKFGKIAAVKLRNAHRADCLITDVEPPADIRAYAEENRLGLVF